MLLYLLQKNTCFTIHESRDTEATSPSFTLVIYEVYSHKQVPLVKVLFCDHSSTPFPSQGPRNLMTAVKYKEVLIQMMANKQESPMIHVTKEVVTKRNHISSVDDALYQFSQSVYSFLPKDFRDSSAFPRKGSAVFSVVPHVRFVLKCQAVSTLLKDLFSLQGLALFRRLLYSNAKRLMQTERLKPVWIDSFLQLRFQEDKHQF